MKKVIFTIFFVFLNVVLNAKSPILVYYGDNASQNFLNQFKVVILDPDQYTSVSNLKPFKYGYLSIGEVESFREYFKLIKNLGILKEENPNWKGSYYVDLKSGKWQDFVINYIIPNILSKGYNGIFLDTVDSLIYTEKNKKLIIDFINSIKNRYPYVKIMMNRGFQIADRVKVDAILIESTITSYNFKTKKYHFLKKCFVPEIPEKVEKFSLDYWYLNDFLTIKKIYKKALKLGYKPYVGEISLKKLPQILYDEDKKNFIINTLLSHHH